MTTDTPAAPPRQRLQYLRTSRLVPYARNARTHSAAQVAQIAASIREFGFTNPVLVDQDDGIIAGHGRVMAAQQLGLAEVPCIRLAHLSDAQKRAYILADNKLALNAGWDEAMLASELQALADEGFEMELTGFSQNELEQLTLTQDNDSDNLQKEGLDEIPAVNAIVVTRHGDLWSLGPHRLLCGSSTDEQDVSRLMQFEQADIVWTDPPYNIAYDGGPKPTLGIPRDHIANDSMTDSAFAQFLRNSLNNAFNHTKPGACIYVCHSESNRISFTTALQEAGFKFSQTLIWVKQSATISRQDYNWQHEPILYGWKEGAAHYFCRDFTLTTVIDDDLDIDAMKREQMAQLLKDLRKTPSTVIRHDRPTKSELHPTMKPVGLVQRMLEWSSRTGQTVLDLFGGSGTTLMAAEQCGRAARLMEIDPQYVDVIVRRWQAHTGREATLESTGQTFDQVAAARA
jgi:DNA modification methylase